ncbi:helix-turn-helix domain-containing protein [Rhodococcus sp. TAF43]|uniref:helix-turn-helix domain-containing protein n=1 Tax=unclassified Rhodococcus (in: high G+C Gram-positive bacteria) TaxID=192944 RepID=UPI001C2ECC64
MEWLNESQACLLVGTSARSLRRWRQRGDLPEYRQCVGRTMYRRRDVEACAELQRRRYMDRPLQGRPKLTV